MIINDAEVSVLDNDISDHRAIKLKIMIEKTEEKVEERVRLRVRHMRIGRVMEKWQKACEGIYNVWTNEAMERRNT